MHLEHAEHKRDLRLRRRILQLLHAARVHPDRGGWASGRFIVDIVEGAVPSTQTFTDDSHATGLLRDLVAGEFIEQRDDRFKRHHPANLDFTSYRITHRGVALVEEQIAPDPLVEDDRRSRRRR